MNTASAQSGLAEKTEGTSVRTPIQPTGYGSAVPESSPTFSLDSLAETAMAHAREFMEEIEDDEDVARIPAIECLPEFAVSVAKAAHEAMAPMPHIFVGGEGSVGFMWARKQGNCYLYAELDKMEAEWTELEGGERSLEKDLDLRYSSNDWDVLTHRLHVACAE